MNKIITVPSVTIISAAPHSGKSHLICYILYSLCKAKKFHFGITFTATSFTKDYNFMPHNFIHETYDEKILVSLMEIQAWLKKQGINRNAFIIFDDVLGSVNFSNNLILILITQFHHYNINIIISTQYIYKLPPVVQECSTYSVIFRQFQKKSYNALFETFGQTFDKYLDFKHFVDKYTNVNYQFILVKNQTNDSKEKYMVMKAPSKIPDFKLNF